MQRCLTVGFWLNVVVVHLWASLYAAAASKINGETTQVAAARAPTEFAIIGGSAGGFEFVSTAVETGGRLEPESLRLLPALGDVVAASNSRLLEAASKRRALAELECSVRRGTAGECKG